MKNSGQSAVEALLSILIVTSLTSLMFHSGIKLCKLLLTEQLLAEKLLTDFSVLQTNRQ